MHVLFRKAKDSSDTECIKAGLDKQYDKISMPILQHAPSCFPKNNLEITTSPFMT